MKSIIKIIFLSPAFWIIVVSIVAGIGYMMPGMPVIDDGQDHVARIANFYQSLSEGNPIPRWAGNLNWGYGHPILMFLYPLPSYIASLFHFIGFSFVDSTKIVFIVAFIASTLAMYFWMRSAFGTIPGILGAFLYGFAPYRFVDMYIRGAIGEHVAFIFPPLICFFLFKIAQEGNKSFYGIGLSVVSAGLILAHNAVSIMFFPIIAFYVLYLFVFESKRSLSFIFSVFCYLALGFGLSAFFWVPAYLEGKYTLRDIVTKKEALERFVPLTKFIFSPWVYGQGNETTKFIGATQWVGIIGSIFLISRVKKFKEKISIMSLLIMFILYIFMMTSLSSIVWEKIMILQKFQFPWRFQCATVFINAVLASLVLTKFITVQKKGRQISLLVLLCVLSVVVTAGMWRPGRGYTFHHDSYYSGVYAGTTDTGESSPIWSVRFMEHTASRPIQVIEGQAEIQEAGRTSTEHR